MSEPRGPAPAEADVALLIAFEALLRERNVTRAAARLGLSQSALSSRLARLREIFGDALFVPAANGRGMVATPRALQLGGGLSDALGSLRAMLRPPPNFAPAASRRTFVLALHEQPAAVLAPRLCRAVLAEAPGVRLAFVVPGEDAADQLEAGTLDLLLASDPGRAAGLMTRALLAETLVTAQRKGHPRGTAPLDLDAFCTLDHLIVSTRVPDFSGFVDRALAGLGRARRVAISLGSYALAPLVVARTDCVCTLPLRLLRPFVDRLDFFPPPLPLPTPELFAFWHARSQNDAGHAWLREQVYHVADATEDA